MIIIKRYPTRRLYDTSLSKYVNLKYIRELIVSNQDFKIIDSKTEEDKTRNILLQIIGEEETSVQQSLLTDNLLKKLICFYGNDNQNYMQQFLEQSLNVFLEQQDNMQTVMSNLNKTAPFEIFNNIVKQNIDMWSNINSPNDKK
ncbi:MAG: polyhydroxyalkanoate synthesis repressor PhaR [Gammaproteobacteria bacterium]|nr:polyhydroxyalkanoate synthesis repressor PhaR [Gammaproteobacteria bacterium]